MKLNSKNDLLIYTKKIIPMSNKALVVDPNNSIQWELPKELPIFQTEFRGSKIRNLKVDPSKLKYFIKEFHWLYNREYNFLIIDSKYLGSRPVLFLSEKILNDFESDPYQEKVLRFGVDWESKITKLNTMLYTIEQFDLFYERVRRFFSIIRLNSLKDSYITLKIDTSLSSSYTLLLLRIFSFIDKVYYDVDLDYDIKFVNNMIKITKVPATILSNKEFLKELFEIIDKTFSILRSFKTLDTDIFSINNNNIKFDDSIVLEPKRYPIVYFNKNDFFPYQDIFLDQILRKKILKYNTVYAFYGIAKNKNQQDYQYRVNRINGITRVGIPFRDRVQLKNINISIKKIEEILHE